MKRSIVWPMLVLLTAPTASAQEALAADTFEQTFDLAPPGQEFTCYSKGIMKRQKGAPD